MFVRGVGGGGEELSAIFPFKNNRHLEGLVTISNILFSYLVYLPFNTNIGQDLVIKASQEIVLKN